MTEKKVDTWMPFLVDKYLGDTTHLSTEQHGAYVLLLLTMWKRGGELPDDDEQLLNITRLRPERWKASRAVLRAFFDVDGDVLRQKRLSAELVRAQANLDQKSAAGKASAAAKKAQREANEKATAVATGVPTEDQRTPPRIVKPTPTPTSLRSGVSKASPSHPPAGGRFAAFWAAWPKNDRKQDKKACLTMWKDRAYDAIADTILVDVHAKRGTRKWQEGYIEAPKVYLHNRRWEDGSTDEAEDLRPWFDTRPGIEAKAAELGIPAWDEYAASIGQGERFDQYTARVFAAAGHSPRKAA